MASYRISSCAHCDTTTHIGHYNSLKELQRDIDCGLAQCEQCLSEDRHHTDFDIMEALEDGSFRLAGIGQGNILKKVA